MKTYRMLAGLLITVLLITSSSYAKEWSAIFSGGKGTRLDFNPQVGGLKINEDGSSYLYRFIVPETGMKATVILLFHGETGKTAASPEAYNAEILQRSEEMIVMRISLGGGEQIDRFQIYSVFPKTGIGFCTTVSAYVTGTKELRALAATDPKIPPASTGTVSFFRVE